MHRKTATNKKPKPSAPWDKRADGTNSKWTKYVQNQSMRDLNRTSMKQNFNVRKKWTKKNKHVQQRYDKNALIHREKLIADSYLLSRFGFGVISSEFLLWLIWHIVSMSNINNWWNQLRCVKFPHLIWSYFPPFSL